MKLRLTKNELKKQKDVLKRYTQYLPTLVLKKQQLQTELLKIHKKMEAIRKQREYTRASIYKWADVFTEKAHIDSLVSLKGIKTSRGNIAGVDIPVFEKAVFDEKPYDMREKPIWTDYGIEAVKEVIAFNAEREVMKKQDRLIKEELRITTQRVNLFEKVMIPGAVENIRKINIYLGDMQTAAVVRGKIAKEKILKTTSHGARATSHEL